MINVLFPFIFLGFLLLRILLPRFFPEITRAEFLGFMLFLPGFLLLIVTIVEKVREQDNVSGDGLIEWIKALSYASITASILTGLMK